MPKQKRSKDQLKGPQQGNCMITEIELPVFAAYRNWEGHIFQADSNLGHNWKKPTTKTLVAGHVVMYP